MGEKTEGKEAADQGRRRKVLPLRGQVCLFFREEEDHDKAGKVSRASGRGEGADQGRHQNECR